MKILFATTNPAKVKRFADKLQERNIEIITLKDLGINIDVEETGNNSLENAYIKAKTYYEIAKIPTMSMDCSLFIEGIPEEKQPGIHTRRVNGKELNDDEMLEYYVNLVNQYGGKLSAKWVYGMVIYDGNEKKEFTWSKDHFYLIDKPSEKRRMGYPLDSISITANNNKYFVEMTPEEKIEKSNSDDKVIDFIVNSVKKGEKNEPN